MSNISGNTCSVVTILPLGVDCYSVNATTPVSNDGAIYLTITGGSTPYNITWDNELKTNNIYNLYPGSYTVTIVDYYGDYSATTTCEVGSDSFYLDYFQSCSASTFAYFTGLTESQLILGGVYKFENTQGCWTYSGKTLYTGQTYTGDVLSVYYETCEDCDPQTVTPYYPITLCLYSTSETFTAYPFSYAGVVNDKPSYSGTGVSSGYTIQWVDGFINQWMVLGKTGNSLVNTNDTYNPLGSWSLLGTQQTWIATSGTCPTNSVLDFNLTVNNESCDGLCDGSVLINANGGVGGYTYSIDGVNYQSSPVFNNLCDQSGIIYVKDSGNTINSKTFTVNAGSQKTTYRLSIESNQIDTQLNYGTQVKSKLDYVVKVTPSLPSGVTINVPIYISVLEDTSKPGLTNIIHTPSTYSGTTLISPTVSALTNTQTIVPSPFAYNYPYPTTRKTYSIQYSNIELTSNNTISGNVITAITKISGGTQSCSSKSVYNPTNSVKYYSWVNCTGGTETGYTVSPNQTVEICANSVTPLPILGQGLIVGDGNLNCSDAITDGKISVSVGFNGPSISNDCSVLIVQTPQPQQLYSQLYSPIYYGNSYS